MFHALLNPLLILVLFVFVYCGDVALHAMTTLPRKIVYGLLAFLALAYLIVVLFVRT